jgi:xanthine dehydrogenase accessory factor
MRKDIVIVRSAGDIATAVAHRLHNCGFRLLLLEIEQPLVVRRKVSFAAAVMEGAAEIEGVKAVKAENMADIEKAWADGFIPVLCDKDCSILNELKPLAVIDATMAKRYTGTNMSMAPITIATGPGFEAGVHVDAVIETKRGHDLGRVIYSGFAEADTGVPGVIAGYSSERLLRAPISGIITNVLDIGSRVEPGDFIATVSGEPVKSQISGVVRGLIADGSRVEAGVKIGDVDPRGIVEYCYTISDKSRAVAGGVLEALMHLMVIRRISI